MTSDDLEESDSDIDVMTVGDDSSKLPFLAPMVVKSSTPRVVKPQPTTFYPWAQHQQQNSLSEYMLHDKQSAYSQPLQAHFHPAAAVARFKSSFSIEEIMRK